jgi:hypothetical protein
MDKQAEQLLRDTSASLCCDWLTSVPFEMSELRIEKVGFAEIPLVFVMVACPEKAIAAMVPVVRQFVFRELAAAGIENEVVGYIPTVQDQGRRRRCGAWDGLGGTSSNHNAVEEATILRAHLGELLQGYIPVRARS